MTIEQAFELRIEIKSKPRNERNVIEAILFGQYDSYKEEAITIAKEDAAFLLL